MSPRTFARRFRDTVGTTPLQWLLTQRVVLAQRLLETTDAADGRRRRALRARVGGQPAAARRPASRAWRRATTARRSAAAS